MAPDELRVSLDDLRSAADTTFQNASAASLPALTTSSLKVLRSRSRPSTAWRWLVAVGGNADVNAVDALAEVGCEVKTTRDREIVSLGAGLDDVRARRIHRRIKREDKFDGLCLPFGDAPR
ncbi:uncharacterized protein BKCO1_2700080 [Diplodia corticola]|uniref:Uncharacterized protein n=1 Tax=Diplodia corticola TaxID=236234 RepID=A0A1J9S198_9PEZI|nr:uncharacterized protein BKCO1_2700080 [Diplodia corticola]OJD33796.1 hypothetical protein BKCO1_2700080 [Diplodia corticola]